MAAFVCVCVCVGVGAVGVCWGWWTCFCVGVRVRRVGRDLKKGWVGWRLWDSGHACHKVNGEAERVSRQFGTRARHERKSRRKEGNNGKLRCMTESTDGRAKSEKWVERRVVVLGG